MSKEPAAVFRYGSLVSRYGEREVERAAIFVTQATDRKGLLVNIPPTTKAVTAVLKALHDPYTP